MRMTQRGQERAVGTEEGEVTKAKSKQLYARAEKALSELKENTWSYYCETGGGLHATSWIGSNPEFGMIEQALTALKKARRAK